MAEHSGVRAELNAKGGRRKRVNKLAAGAEPNLEPGEVIHEVVQTQTGQSALETAGGIANLAGPGEGALPNVTGSFALIATDRHVYAMPLGGPTLTDVKEPQVKITLADAQIRREGRKIIVQGATFHVMALFGKRAKSFVDYVGEHPAPG